MSDYSAPAPQGPYDSAPQTTGSVPGQPAPGRTLGIVAFVLSFFFQLFGLILGIVALVQSRKAGRKNGFALAAIIISIVLGIIGIIAIIALIAFGAAAGNYALEAVQQCQAAGGTGTVVIEGTEVECSAILEAFENQQ